MLSRGVLSQDKGYEIDVDRWVHGYIRTGRFKTFKPFQTFKP